MAEVNFNSIYDGVSLALHAAFPAAQVHGGNVKQGLKPGDFNVIMPGAGHAKEVGQRYKRTPTVDVIYYPKAGDAECYGMAHRLSFVLGSITTPEGDIIHATGCEWTLAEDVLHVLLSYDHFVRVPLEQENMETLKINEEGKANGKNPDHGGQCHRLYQGAVGGLSEICPPAGPDRRTAGGWQNLHLE